MDGIIHYITAQGPKYYQNTAITSTITHGNDLVLLLPPTILLLPCHSPLSPKSPPINGFTIKCYLSAHSKHLVCSKQRNVTLPDKGFLHLVMNLDRCVVGTQVFTPNGDMRQGVVLIKKDGALCNTDHDGEIVTSSTSTRFKQYYQIGGGGGGSSCCPPGFSVCGEW